MNNLPGSGLTAIVEPAQKIVEPAQKPLETSILASERDSSPKNLVETGVQANSTLLSAGNTLTDLKGTATELIDPGLELTPNMKSALPLPDE